MVTCPADLSGMVEDDDYCHAVCADCYPEDDWLNKGGQLSICGKLLGEAKDWDAPECPKCQELWDVPCPVCGGGM